MNLNLASKYEYEEEEKQEFTRFDRTYPEILVFQPAYDDDRVITINPELLSTVDILSVLFKKIGGKGGNWKFSMQRRVYDVSSVPN